MVKRFLGAGSSLFSTSLLRQSIAFAIIFQIILGSNLGLAADSGSVPNVSKDYSVYLPQDLKALATESFFKNDSQYNEMEKLFIEKYFNEAGRKNLNQIILARALIEKANETDNVEEKIRSRKSDVEVAVEMKGLGKAEFNSLGYPGSGRPFTRFVDYQSNTSDIFIDTDIVPLDTLTAKDLGQMDIDPRQLARDAKIFNSELNRYVAIQQMHTKVHPQEYNPLPDLSEINPEEAKVYLQELIDNAKKNPPKKNYDGEGKVVTGRHTRVITYSGKSQIIKSIKEYQRYEDLSPIGKVKVYWNSIKQGTRINWDYWDQGNVSGKIKGLFTGDVLVGLFSTVMQTGIFVSLKGFDVDPLSLILVSGWAFAFSITPTVRNWININPSKSSVLFKSFLNSMVFNYIMLIAIHGVDAVFSLNAAAFNMAYLAISNAIINNFGKVWWYKIPQMRQRAGLNLRQLNIGNFKTKVDQSSIEQQAWYLGSNIFRTADLLAMGSLFTFLSIEFTASRIAMLLTIPTMHFLIMKYAEKRDFKEKHVLRAEWEKANYLHWEGQPVLFKGHKIPIFYMGAAKMFVQETWLIAKNSAMLVYWPAKVVFDALKAATTYTVNQLSAAAKTAIPNLEPKVYAPKAAAVNSCRSIFN